MKFGPPVALPEKAPTASTMLLVWALFFCIYTYLPMPTGHASSIPFGPALILAAILCVKTEQRWDPRVIKLLGIVALIGYTGVATGPNAGGYILQRLSTTSFFVSSLFVAVVVYYEIATWPAKTLRRFFGVVTLILIVGATLEQFTPLKAVSDWYRTTTGIEGSVYDSDLRDLMDTGVVRPKFFAREPSILAGTIGFCALMWLMLAQDDKLRLVKYTVLAGAGVVASRSPTMFVMFPGAIFVTFLARQPGPANKTLSVASRVWLVVLIGAATLLLLFVLAKAFMGHRLAHITAGKDTSSKTRLIFPIVMTYHVLTTYPWFGLGLGGGNAVVDETLKVLASIGIPPKSFVKSGEAGHLFPNALMEYWATFGVIGGVAIFVFLRRLQKILAPYDSAVILVIVLLLSFNGGFVGGPYFWTLCALVASVSAVRWRAALAAMAPRPVPAISPSAPPALESPA